MTPLYEGIPSWLRHGLASWVVNSLRHPMSIESKDIVSVVGQRFHLTLNWSKGVDSAISSIVSLIDDETAEQALDIIDFLLSLTPVFGPGKERMSILELSLSVGSSTWRVEETGDRPCLVRRVDETVVQRYAEESVEPGNASAHLKKAWIDLYGRNPDASSSYRESTRAIEAALKPIVLPKNDKATLGTMINAMRDKPEKWPLAFHLPPSNTAIETVVSLLELCWHGQIDRHGTDDEAIPLHVRDEQAEGALHVALTVVHWCRTGFLSTT